MLLPTANPAPNTHRSVSDMRSSRRDRATRPPAAAALACSAGPSSTATGWAEAREGGEGGHQWREPGLPGSPLCSLPPPPAGLLGQPALGGCWASLPGLAAARCSSVPLPWLGEAAAAAAAGSSTEAHPRSSSLPPLVLAGVLAPLRPAANRSASSFGSLSPPPMQLLSGLRAGPAAERAAATPDWVLPSASSAKLISPSCSASWSVGSAAGAASSVPLLRLASGATRRSTVTRGRAGGCSRAAAAVLAGASLSCCSRAAAGGGGGGAATGCCCCRWRCCGCLAASWACCCCRQATKCVSPRSQVAEKRWPGGGPTCSAKDEQCSVMHGGGSFHASFAVPSVSNHCHHKPHTCTIRHPAHPATPSPPTLSTPFSFSRS